MKELAKLDEIMKDLDKVYRNTPARAASLAVNFSKDRFREQAWLDGTKEPWKKRKRTEPGKRGNRGVLIDSGRLKRSIRKLTVTPNYAVIAAGGTGIKYAQIHNGGGRVQGTFQIKQHTRKAHARKRKGRKGTITIPEHAVKAHARTVNFTIPRRQFIGESTALTKRIELRIQADFARALK